MYINTNNPIFTKEVDLINKHIESLTGNKISENGNINYINSSKDLKEVTEKLAVATKDIITMLQGGKLPQRKALSKLKKVKKLSKQIEKQKLSLEKGRRKIVVGSEVCPTNSPEKKIRSTSPLFRITSSQRAAAFRFNNIKTAEKLLNKVQEETGKHIEALDYLLFKDEDLGKLISKDNKNPVIGKAKISKNVFAVVKYKNRLVNLTVKAINNTCRIEDDDGKMILDNKGKQVTPKLNELTFDNTNHYVALKDPMGDGYIFAKVIDSKDLNKIKLNIGLGVPFTTSIENLRVITLTDTTPPHKMPPKELNNLKKLNTYIQDLEKGKLPKEKDMGHIALINSTRDLKTLTGQLHQTTKAIIKKYTLGELSLIQVRARLNIVENLTNKLEAQEEFISEGKIISGKAITKPLKKKIKKKQTPPKPIYSTDKEIPKDHTVKGFTYITNPKRVVRSPGYSSLFTSRRYYNIQTAKKDLKETKALTEVTLSQVNSMISTGHEKVNALTPNAMLDRIIENKLPTDSTKALTILPLKEKDPKKLLRLIDRAVLELKDVLRNTSPLRKNTPTIQKKIDNLNKFLTSIKSQLKKINKHISFPQKVFRFFSLSNTEYAKAVKACNTVEGLKDEIQKHVNIKAKKEIQVGDKILYFKGHDKKSGAIVATVTKFSEKSITFSFKNAHKKSLTITIKNPTTSSKIQHLPKNSVKFNPKKIFSDLAIKKYNPKTEAEALSYLHRINYNDSVSHEAEKAVGHLENNLINLSSLLDQTKPTHLNTQQIAVFEESLHVLKDGIASGKFKAKIRKLLNQKIASMQKQLDNFFALDKFFDSFVAPSFTSKLQTKKQYHDLLPNKLQDHEYYKHMKNHIKTCTSTALLAKYAQNGASIAEEILNLAPVKKQEYKYEAGYVDKVKALNHMLEAIYTRLESLKSKRFIPSLLRGLGLTPSSRKIRQAEASIKEGKDLLHGIFKTIEDNQQYIANTNKTYEVGKEVQKMFTTPFPKGTFPKVGDRFAYRTGDEKESWVVGERMENNRLKISDSKDILVPYNFKENIDDLRRITPLLTVPKGTAASTASRFDLLLKKCGKAGTKYSATTSEIIDANNHIRYVVHSNKELLEKILPAFEKVLSKVTVTDRNAQQRIYIFSEILNTIYTQSTKNSDEKYNPAVSSKIDKYRKTLKNLQLKIDSKEDNLRSMIAMNDEKYLGKRITIQGIVSKPIKVLPVSLKTVKYPGIILKGFTLKIQNGSNSSKVAPKDIQLDLTKSKHNYVGYRAKVDGEQIIAKIVTRYKDGSYQINIGKKANIKANLFQLSALHLPAKKGRRKIKTILRTLDLETASLKKKKKSSNLKDRLNLV